MRDLARDDLLAELRALRPEFEREGVTGMSLFGSRARGDNRADSDVDLLVDIEEGREFGLEAAGVYLIIEDHFGLPSTILTRRGIGLDADARNRIAREAVPVF